MMKSVFMLVSLIASVLLVGCTSGFRKNDPFERTIPKRPKWKLQSENPDPHQLIDYKLIYCHKQSYSTNHPPWQTMRFWRSGQVVMGWAYDISNVEEVNTFEETTVGYFKVEGGKLIIEAYTDINFGQYGYGFYEIDKDGDLLRYSFGPSMRHQIELNPPERYERIQTERFLSEADW